MGKIKDYVKKHKDVVPYVIGAGIGLALLGAIGMKAKSEAKTNDYYEEMDHPSMDEGKFTYYVKYHGEDKSNGYHMGHMAGVPVSDLGKAGEAMKQCDGIDENSKISFTFTEYTGE